MESPSTSSLGRELTVVSYPEPQPYGAAWDLQKRLWRHRYAGDITDMMLLLEHRPVVTLGRNAKRSNLLLAPEEFRRRGIELVEVDRGGDVTYHGPEQLIGYWIFDLRAIYQNVHRFMREMEEVLIRVLRPFGIGAGRRAGATGVWTGGAKIAALGLHLSHWVSTHGFALNLNTDLVPFSWIVPCGITDGGVTSMEQVLGRRVLRAEVERRVVEETCVMFDRRPVSIPPDELDRILERVEACGRPSESGGAGP